MIKRLQRKIIVIITLLLTLVMLVVMFTINITAQIQSSIKIKDQLGRIASSNGIEIRSERGEINEAFPEYFALSLDEKYRLRSFSTNREVLLDSDKVIEYANEALASGKNNGNIDNYSYIIENRPSGIIIVFMDITSYIVQNITLLRTTIIVGAVTAMVFLFFSIGLSFWLVKPVRQTLEKQKQFISDASHELKTPLAVIGANADVLEGEIGENKWLGFIRSETVRMSELVNELLSLARLEDNNSGQVKMSEICLSNLILQTVLPFESRFFESGKKLETDVAPDVHIKGDSSILKHIISILLDNADKYSDKGALIKVSLVPKGSKWQIRVFNTGSGIPYNKLDKIFERFYREDEARNSSSGGYGLGLSIARAGAIAHGGSIYAQSEYGKNAEFIVTLPGNH